QSSPTHPSPTQPASAQPPAQSQPSSTQSAPTQPSQAQPAQGPPPSSSQEPSPQGGDVVFHTRAQEVMLHATVVDDKQHMVTNLDKSAFTVLEDGKPQTITSFRHEDIPVALGIVIDNSGSMREKRDRVNQAALNLVRASNKDDQVSSLTLTMSITSIRITPVTSRNYRKAWRKLKRAAARRFTTRWSPRPTI